jgi:hypothetical protein
MQIGKSNGQLFCTHRSLGVIDEPDLNGRIERGRNSSYRQKQFSQKPSTEEGMRIDEREKQWEKPRSPEAIATFARVDCGRFAVRFDRQTSLPHPKCSLLSLKWQRKVITIRGRQFAYWFDLPGAKSIRVELEISGTVAEFKSHLRLNQNGELCFGETSDTFEIPEPDRLGLRLAGRTLGDRDRFFDLGIADQPGKRISVLLLGLSLVFSFRDGEISHQFATRVSVEEIEWRMSQRIGIPSRSP